MTARMPSEYAQTLGSTVDFMEITLSEALIAKTLVGDWCIGASNIDDWVNGARRDALLSFSLGQESPLILNEQQVFLAKDGKERKVVLINRFVDGHFVSKGRGIIGGMSRWSIGGLDVEGGILLVRMTHARGGQDGLLLLVRKDTSVEELRTTIARQAEDYGIGPEDFASLTWVPVP